MKNNPRIISPKLEEGGMGDLIDPIYRTWKEEVIDQVFYDFKVAIIKISLFVVPFKMMF